MWLPQVKKTGQLLPQPHKTECCLSHRSLQHSRFPGDTQNYSSWYFKAPIFCPNYLTIVFKTVIWISSLSVNTEMRKVHPLQYVLCLASLITKPGLLMEISPLWLHNEHKVHWSLMIPVLLPVGNGCKLSRNHSCTSSYNIVVHNDNNMSSTFAPGVMKLNVHSNMSSDSKALNWTTSLQRDQVSAGFTCHSASYCCLTYLFFSSYMFLEPQLLDFVNSTLIWSGALLSLDENWFQTTY